MNEQINYNFGYALAAQRRAEFEAAARRDALVRIVKRNVARPGAGMARTRPGRGFRGSAGRPGAPRTSDDRINPAPIVGGAWQTHSCGEVSE
jgi:hypothetical protein